MLSSMLMEFIMPTTQKQGERHVPPMVVEHVDAGATEDDEDAATGQLDGNLSSGLVLYASSARPMRKPREVAASKTQQVGAQGLCAQSREQHAVQRRSRPRKRM